MIGQAINLAGAGIVIGVAQPFVRSLVGGFVGASPIASAGVTLATAYGLGFVANMLTLTKRFRQPLELAGWTIAATQLASAYVLPMLRLGGAPAANGMGRGMRGIAAVHGVPPNIVALPPPPSRTNGGMAGVAGRPGQWAY